MSGPLSHDETEDQRDARLRAGIEVAVTDFAMHVVAERIGENPNPLADAMYYRLTRWDRYDLARMVVLLLLDSGRPHQMADRFAGAVDMLLDQS